MGITANGKENTFNQGLKNTIDQMEVRNNGSKVGDTQDITVSYDSANPGRIEVDGSVDFEVEAQDEINEIVLINDAQTGKKGDQWVIDLGSGYTFEYDGTFTVEEVWVQFTGPSDPSSDGGITEDGRGMLAEDAIVDRIRSIWPVDAPEFENNVTTNIDGGGVNFSQSQDDPMKLNTPVQLRTGEESYPSNIGEIRLRSDDNSPYSETTLFYLQFSQRSFDYPAVLTITDIEIDID